MDAATNSSQSVPRWIRNSLLGAGIAVLTLYWIRLARIEPGQKMGDFLLHWELGRRLVAGEFLYAGGHDSPYPPFWALAHAPLSLLSSKTAQLLVYPLIVAWLAGLVVVLRKLTDGEFQLNKRAAFWATTLAILFTARYLIRDLTEVGVNLLLVTLSWCAVLLWTRKREWLGGLTLGLAIALKCTPALFWAWFVLKRQWKMAGITAAATLLFSVSPVLVQGPEQFARAGTFWIQNTLRGISHEDPSSGVLGPIQLQNMSLKGTLARFLMELPEWHPGRADHALYRHVLNLDAATANQSIRLILIALVAGVAWRLRKPVVKRTDPALFRECASVSVLILLLSPITWGQHCVGALPALYLMFARRMAERRFTVGTRVFIGSWSVFVLALFGDATGRSIAHLLQSYHVETWCIAALLAVTLGDHARCTALAGLRVGGAIIPGPVRKRAVRRAA
jgi:alpha-1,2-mannosyltransferase